MKRPAPSDGRISAAKPHLYAVAVLPTVAAGRSCSSQNFAMPLCNKLVFGKPGMTLAMKKSFIYKTRVRFTHTDPAGYVFFPRYFEMFQAAVEDWFNDGLGETMAELVLEKGLGLPTATTECTFFLPTRFGEVLEIAVLPQRLGNSSITVCFEGRVGDELRLKGRSVLVMIELKNGRPVPVSEDLRRRIRPYLEGQD
jgi:4-hydroxybenzoyl-CoA thioesterase